MALLVWKLPGGSWAIKFVVSMDKLWALCTPQSWNCSGDEDRGHSVLEQMKDSLSGQTVSSKELCLLLLQGTRWPCEWRLQEKSRSTRGRPSRTSDSSLLFIDPSISGLTFSCPLPFCPFSPNNKPSLAFPLVYLSYHQYTAPLCTTPSHCPLIQSPNQFKF
jgi:hypothetical protein